MWQQVECDRVWKNCSRLTVRSVGTMRARYVLAAHRAMATVFFRPRFCLAGQLFNASTAAARDCLVRRSKNPVCAENLMQRIKGHEHHGCCAIWIRDDSAMESHVLCVDLRNDERHMRIHSECRRLVDGDGIRLARDRDIVSGNVAASAEESDVDFFERSCIELCYRNRVAAELNGFPD